jgi:hypothetical protein
MILQKKNLCDKRIGCNRFSLHEGYLDPMQKEGLDLNNEVNIDSNRRSKFQFIVSVIESEEFDARENLPNLKQNL